MSPPPPLPTTPPPAPPPFPAPPPIPFPRPPFSREIPPVVAAPLLARTPACREPSAPSYRPAPSALPRSRLPRRRRRRPRSRHRCHRRPRRRAAHPDPQPPSPPTPSSSASSSAPLSSSAPWSSPSGSAAAFPADAVVVLVVVRAVVVRAVIIGAIVVRAVEQPVRSESSSTHPRGSTGRRRPSNPLNQGAPVITAAPAAAFHAVVRVVVRAVVVRAVVVRAVEQPVRIRIRLPRRRRCCPRRRLRGCRPRSRRRRRRHPCIPAAVPDDVALQAPWLQIHEFKRRWTRYVGNIGSSDKDADEIDERL